MKIKYWLIAVVLGVLPGAGMAQPERYELGRRVIELEKAYDKIAEDAEAKKRVAPVANDAVQKFFSFNLSGAGRALDEARYQIIYKKLPDDQIRWIDSLQVTPSVRTIDSKTETLEVTIKQFYKPDIKAPEKATMQFSIGKMELMQVPLNELPKTVNLPLKGINALGTSDEYLKATVMINEAAVGVKTVQLSVADNLIARIEALEKFVKDAKEKTLEVATMENHVATLKLLMSKTIPETDLPGAAMLREAEKIVENKGEFYTAKRPGQFWLKIPTGKTDTIVRIQVPEKLEMDKKVPIVFTLHGMGGSENLFFDGYGAGVYPKMAKERGWICVAPRVPGLLGGGAPDVPALIDALSKRYPIDSSKVFLVGHSMGAGHSCQLVSKEPGKYAAVVALGGGNRLAKPEAVKEVPFYVGCGKLDFARRGAQSLHESLDKAGVKSIHREYDDIEHLLIVQEAAKDVFKFYDGVVGKK